MPEAWQLMATVAAGFALSTWYAWIRTREASDAWISAWHYWPSRRDETRAAYDRWRWALAALVVATVIAAAGASLAYVGRSPAGPKAAAADVGA
jgi:hypothetical protein